MTESLTKLPPINASPTLNANLSSRNLNVEAQFKTNSTNFMNSQAKPFGFSNRKEHFLVSGMKKSNGMDRSATIMRDNSVPKEHFNTIQMEPVREQQRYKSQMRGAQKKSEIPVMIMATSGIRSLREDGGIKGYYIAPQNVDKIHLGKITKGKTKTFIDMEIKRKSIVPAPNKYSPERVKKNIANPISTLSPRIT